MNIEEIVISFGVTGGLSGLVGYAVGRMTRLAVDILKWIVGAIVMFQILLSQLGIITIHFDELNRILSNIFGSSEPSIIFNQVTNILLSVIPSTLGLGAGFYAGYKKLLL